MTKVVRIDGDVHGQARRLIATYPEASRPSKQKLINETLRAKFAQLLRACDQAKEVAEPAKSRSRRRRAS